MTVHICYHCDEEFDTKPVTDPDEWTPPLQSPREWCSPECLEASAEAYWTARWSA